LAGSIPAASGRIFISYRREETAYPAGWLYDRLADHFGGDQVFKDVDSIELGDDFVEKITSAVGSCDVLLALIGAEWLTITDARGRRRLDNTDDFVRLEIEAALTRNVRVIPILVDEAKMPHADELPPSLARLVRRQALELSPSRFASDTGRLLKVLDRTLVELRTEQDDAASERVPAEKAPDPRATEVQQGRDEQELRLSSQITDRFTNAINQLGSDSKPVRIGGIFALEQIARDSPQDRPNIASTLATFVRESQPAAAVHEQSYIPALKLRAPDVQAALTVLCRSPLCDDRVKASSTEHLDLSRTDLRRASLSGAHLERVSLWGARLEGANLRGAHLQGTVLSGANLGRFDPLSTEYQFGADLSDADLTGALLDGVIDLHVTKTTDGTRGLST
jgi:hypothetical protein